MDRRDKTARAANGEGTEGATRQSRLHVRLDDRNVNSCYANFCRVTGTPEELILDFGLNSQPFGEQSEPVPITHRVVLNFYTAKRMLAALQLTIQRHETAFGLLETDVQKRVVPGAAPSASPLA
jgi:hypothetical protein